MTLLSRNRADPYNADSLQPDGPQSPGSLRSPPRDNPQGPGPLLFPLAFANYDQFGRSLDYIRQIQSDINPTALICPFLSQPKAMPGGQTYILTI